MNKESEKIIKRNALYSYDEHGRMSEKEDCVMIEDAIEAIEVAEAEAEKETLLIIFDIINDCDSIKEINERIESKFLSLK